MLYTVPVNLPLSVPNTFGERFKDQIEALLSRRVRPAKPGRDSAGATVPFTATPPPLHAVRRLSENRATASSAAGRRPDRQR